MMRSSIVGQVQLAKYSYIKYTYSYKLQQCDIQFTFFFIQQYCIPCGGNTVNILLFIYFLL